MKAEEIRTLKQDYCTAHDDIQAYALLEIAAQLAEINAALKAFATGQEVLCVETGLDKGEPLDVRVVNRGAA